MPGEYRRPDSAPIAPTTAGNAMMLDVVRQAVDSIRYECDRRAGDQAGRLDRVIAEVRANREVIVELVGRDGRGGLRDDFRHSRESQGKRLEALKDEIRSLEARVGKGEASLADLRLRTKLALGAIATAMGAAGAGVAELLGRLF